MMNIGTVIALIKQFAPVASPEVIAQAVNDYLDDHPEIEVADGSITEEKLASDVLLTLSTLGSDLSDVKNAIHQVAVTPESFGAKGDGVTDDSQAIRDAIASGYNVRFEDNKTYYVASAISIHNDVKLTGGKNTVIKTKTPQGGVMPNVISISGTLKKETTLTSDYKSNGTGDNANNKFTLSDMDGVNVGDIMVIVAEDQYYSYARQYYYLGATLLITDVYDGHIYTSESMPFDINNSVDVTVKIYSAPQAIIENLHFEADLDSQGNYKYLLSLSRCKNTVVRDCTFGEMDNGISLHECFNTLLSNIMLSKSKYDNTMEHDSYGIAVYSCTNTIIERVIATCAQHAITITGNEPSINTYVRNCDLTSECRNSGIDTHEAIYNLVIEDCVLGVASLNGTAKMIRCRIINNRRVSNNQMYVSIYGNRNPKFSQIQITDCIFDNTGITFESDSQNPIQSYDQVFGNVLIENCVGGTIIYLPSVTATILSNTIERMEIRNCKDIREIYTDGVGKINSLIIKDTTFTEGYYINNHAGAFMLNGIKCLNVLGIDPMIKKLMINRDTHGERLLLPANTKISLSSGNASAKYFVCGKNLVSDDADDYEVGQVSGNSGNNLTRTKSTGENVPTISIDENGGIVYQQKNNASSYYVYPKYMFYIPEHSFVAVSAKLKNTGATNPSKFMAYIVTVDCKTGKVFNRDAGNLVTATAEGASISFSMQATGGDKIAMAYFYNYDPVANSETTIADVKVRVSAYSTPEDYTDEPFQCNRLTGDGNVLSLAGVNNIMSRELTFHASLKADYVSNPIL